MSSNFQNMNKQLNNVNNITCISQKVGGNNSNSGIDILFYDSNLPGDLKPSNSTNEIIGFISWFPNYSSIRDIHWSIKSNKHKLLMKEYFTNSDKLNNNFIEILQTDFELYKNKYNTLFKAMALRELSKYQEFKKWNETRLITY